MLTDLKLKSIKFTDKVTLFPDQDGLYLRVSKTKKRWQLSFMKDGKQLHFYAKDEYPVMSLRQAREWAESTRTIAIEGHVASTSQFSMGHFLKLYREQQEQNNRAPATIKKIDSRTNKYLKPYLSKDIRSFTPQSVLAILRPIGAEKKIEAQKQMRQLLNNIFLHAVLMGVRETNPVDNLHRVLPTSTVVSRAAITNYRDFGDLLLKLHDSDSQACVQVRTALRLAPLVFVRPDNLRFAEWSEINFKTNTWHIPGPKMKMEEPLDVPLSNQAINILFSMKPITGNQKYVFASNKGQPFSEVLMRNELIRLGYYGAHMKNVPENAKYHSPHGFRASARTIMDEVLEFRVDVIEHQLGHMVRDANGTAYNRTKHMEKRRIMMQLWADFCDVLMNPNRKERDQNAAAFIKNHKGLV